MLGRDEEGTCPSLTCNRGLPASDLRYAASACALDPDALLRWSSNGQVDASSLKPSGARWGEELVERAVKMTWFEERHRHRNTPVTIHFGRKKAVDTATARIDGQGGRPCAEEDASSIVSRQGMLEKRMRSAALETDGDSSRWQCGVHAVLMHGLKQAARGGA